MDGFKNGKMDPDNGHITIYQPFLPKNEGWMMRGEYFTSTDAKGAHYLEINALLESPIDFDPK